MSEGKKIAFGHDGNFSLTNDLCRCRPFETVADGRRLGAVVKPSAACMLTPIMSKARQTACELSRQARKRDKGCLPFWQPSAFYRRATPSLPVCLAGHWAPRTRTKARASRVSETCNISCYDVLQLQSMPCSAELRHCCKTSALQWRSAQVSHAAKRASIVVGPRLTDVSIF